MIIGLIILVLFTLLSAVVGLIPAGDVFEPIYSGTTGGAATTIASFLKTWDLFVPIIVCFNCVLAVLGAKVFVAVAKLVVFVWDKLPFKSS